MPFVSAIIPVYNGAERYLKEAIESVLRQTFTDFELIVVDDASTDEIESVIRKYSAVRYIRRPSNGGQAAARNDGARLASGEYIAFLDQDDLWEPDMLSQEVHFANIHPEAGVIFSDGFMVDENNKILSYDSAIKPWSNLPQGLSGGYDIGNCKSLIKKACFDAIGCYDERLYLWEDIDLSVRLYRRFPTVHIPKALHRHRVYSNNVSRSIHSERTFASRQLFLQKNMPLHAPGSLQYKALMREWAILFSDMGKYHSKHGDFASASRFLIQSLRHNPFCFKTYSRLIRTYLRGVWHTYRTGA